MDPSCPFKGGPSGYIFTLISCPLHPMGPSSFSGWTQRVTVQDFGGWRFKGQWVDGLNTNAVNYTNSWQVVRKPLWRIARVSLWLDFTLDQSVASSSMHSLYKYQCLSFSFLYFQLKHIVRAQTSSFSETTPSSLYIRHQHSSSVHSQNW